MFAHTAYPITLLFWYRIKPVLPYVLLFITIHLGLTIFTEPDTFGQGKTFIKQVGPVFSFFLTCAIFLQIKPTSNLDANSSFFPRYLLAAPISSVKLALLTLAGGTAFNCALLFILYGFGAPVKSMLYYCLLTMNVFVWFQTVAWKPFRNQFFRVLLFIVSFAFLQGFFAASKRSIAQNQSIDNHFFYWLILHLIVGIAAAIWSTHQARTNPTLGKYKFPTFGLLLRNNNLKIYKSADAAQTRFEIAASWKSPTLQFGLWALLPLLVTVTPLLSDNNASSIAVTFLIVGFGIPLSMMHFNGTVRGIARVNPLSTDTVALFAATLPISSVRMILCKMKASAVVYSLILIPYFLLCWRVFKDGLTPAISQLGVTFSFTTNLGLLFLISLTVYAFMLATHCCGFWLGLTKNSNKYVNIIRVAFVIIVIVITSAIFSPPVKIDWPSIWNNHKLLLGAALYTVALIKFAAISKSIQWSISNLSDYHHLLIVVGILSGFLLLSFGVVAFYILGISGADAVLAAPIIFILTPSLGMLLAPILFDSERFY